jgi:FdhD protein
MEDEPDWRSLYFLVLLPFDVGGSQMTLSQQASGVVGVSIEKVIGSMSAGLTDTLSIEEPLEIRLTADFGGRRSSRAVAVTMRTPGDDCDLAAGFLFTEGIISKTREILDVWNERPNVVEVALRHEVEVDLSLMERHSFVASSCGVCGKRSIAAISVKRKYPIPVGEPIITPDLIHALAPALRRGQQDFARTGGIHAAGLFDSTGQLLLVREDVGRHNALDKLVGAELLAGHVPLSQRILMVSGRASFELVQKAAQAGVPVLAAVSAPSSLAVQLARECGMTLLGFIRDDRFNVYAGADRVVGLLSGGSRFTAAVGVAARD